MIFGDLAFYIGIVGIIIYVCLMIIRYTTRSGQVIENSKRYENRIPHLQHKVEELRAERDKKNPEVDKLVEQVVDLRATRDKLQMHYEEMQEKIRVRQIHIKTNLTRDSE